LENQQHPSLFLQLPNTFRAFYSGFPCLHRAQKEAIDPILKGLDLVLQAATGSGKSEAVLAPALERVIGSGRDIAVLYIIPTRALAFDLRRRFEFIITERLGLNLAIRTGDIKRRGGDRPDIMFTTPESLDVMLGSANAHLKGFLSRARIVIIDEIQPLVYHYRGRHLACLLIRLEQRTHCPLQKIAMSATIANVDDVVECFGFSSKTKHIVAPVKRKILARLLHIKQETSEIPALLDDLYHAWHYRKILVFANSRTTCDRVFGIVNRAGKFQGVCYLHYSNLKLEERKKTEEKFRKSPHALCIATSTLELGIDIGDVDAVLLYEPPWSVSAFLQRIGRANRRKTRIHFWGICCKENAANQVVRFLALLDLAAKGIIEAPWPRTLPSVLSQQVISCLYEKKLISLPSLQSLFPGHTKILPGIFKSLEKKRWLKRSRVNGLFQGGWQYRNYLLEYKIWANFPEAEETCVLEVGKKAIADIPMSIVAQMEVGDNVFIAGLRLEIMVIDTNLTKKILARPSSNPDEKQLAWVGPGAHVSYEVSQAMGHILKTGEIKDEVCLFRRAKKLLNQQFNLGEDPVILENGIRVVQGKTAPFRFQTFLGSAGNLVLEWMIRENFMTDDFFILSDETSIECSEWICFEKLDLPVDRHAFQIWVERHFKILSVLTPLNLFCKALPKSLVIEELTEFLFDRRIADAFKAYLGSSSNIVSGDKSGLLPGTGFQKSNDPVLIDIIPKYSLLQAARDTAGKYAGHQYTQFFKDIPHKRPALETKAFLTATMVSQYFFYAQCKQRFCLSFSGKKAIEPNQDSIKAKARTLGLIHEKQVLDHLKNQGYMVIAMPMAGGLESVIKEGGTLYDIALEKPVFLSQCKLHVDSLGPGVNLKGVGIPDLLKISKRIIKGKNQIVIEAGDIKAGRLPRYSHKWQVAFYALLLEKIIAEQGIAARVAETGFLLTRPSLDSQNQTFDTHQFDLGPYMTAFPMLFNTMCHVLSHPMSDADHRLGPGCVSCEFFAPCYFNALKKEEIQFLPGLTPGELLKIRQQGWTDMKKTHTALEKLSHTSKETTKNSPMEGKVNFPAGQGRHLSGRCRAILENRIYLYRENTRLFPCNISQAFFIYLEKDRLTRLPRAFGWMGIDDKYTIIESCVWIMENENEIKTAWQEFSTRISNAWEKSISGKAGPHLFHFGSGSRRDVQEWGKAYGNLGPKFLWETQPSPWTDLKQIFKAHFYLPCPGTVSFFSLGHGFSCHTQIDSPESLFHADEPEVVNGADFTSKVKARLLIMKDLYEKAGHYLKSQWIREWEIEPDQNSDILPAFLDFIQEEARLKENDILACQEQSLQERMDQFRAIGYLKFCHTRLDHEGRFLYIFKTTRQAFFSKFRTGDFLKIALHGIKDIQEGFDVILDSHDIKEGEICLLSRTGKLFLNKNLLYSLEEDISDWNQAKLIHAAEFACSRPKPHLVLRLLAGQVLDLQPGNSVRWLEHWLQQMAPGLNPAQQQAMACHSNTGQA